MESIHLGLKNQGPNGIEGSTPSSYILGPVTQLIECFLCKEEVAGLSPVRSIYILGDVAQLVELFLQKLCAYG